jgi:hypothetical protein
MPTLNTASRPAAPRWAQSRTDLCPAVGAYQITSTASRQKPLVPAAATSPAGEADWQQHRPAISIWRRPRTIDMTSATRVASAGSRRPWWPRTRHAASTRAAAGFTAMIDTRGSPVAHVVARRCRATAAQTARGSVVVHSRPPDRRSVYRERLMSSVSPENTVSAEVTHAVRGVARRAGLSAGGRIATHRRPAAARMAAMPQPAGRRWWRYCPTIGRRW